MLLAALVLKKGQAHDEVGLFAWCQGRLALFKLPKATLFVAEILRNPSGKILKRVLREQFRDTLRAPQ